MLSSTTSVCAATSSPTRSPAALKGPWPAVKTMSPTRIPWLYGPPWGGPSWGLMMVWGIGISSSGGAGIVSGGYRGRRPRGAPRIPDVPVPVRSAPRTPRPPRRRTVA